MDRPTLIALLYQLADDELVIGHRDSEWLGLAPHIEEDVAFSSIAQDEVGHANLYYHLLEELGEGRADDLAFLRPAAARRNAVLLERPNGPGSYLDRPEFDWGYTIARRLAYDLFDQIRLEVLAGSSHAPLAQAAARIRREERYHLIHHTTWFRRLAHGTDESRRRLAAGVARAWPDVGGLFSLGEVVPGPLFPATAEEMVDRWTAAMRPLFAEVGFDWPGSPVPGGFTGPDGRRGQHTPDLDGLLETMGEVYRIAPGAAW
ncbi:ring-1,2-phenylacetyl-CoA epoxidase subunit PaaC [Symbiobacterium terraclitae]|uniref:Ring-1,2-phenylacetyl-CoA epoxidase subunit PaaC n=1 Tax=Symbiobacterium terraclitae TaxID=557451 RepID=A0ABS4JSR9_9FIRM|nr:1,2-phenylacetyl-CoA epoxidase subunit PaaC [Symbiobacterium terraclitae]MBP2018578.1 ring-1,2-phenylacetyl-CoA epoxidase subunit PaaC [Symbiobacterium terraclitae]